MKHTLWILTLAMLAPAVVLAQAQKPSDDALKQSELPSHADAESPRQRPGVQQGYLQVGDLAQDFELDGSKGKAVKLSQLRGDWLLLAFADRKEAAAKLRPIHDKLAAHGARIALVCHEKSGSLKRYAQQQKLPFLLLADVTGEVASVYGLWDGRGSRTLEGFLLLDRRGVVRQIFVDQVTPPEQVGEMAMSTITHH